MSNYKIRTLELGRHFTIIDSPVPFWLVANPMKSNSQEIGFSGTDNCYRMAGAWQLDNWKLLPKEYMKNNPAFNMGLVWDDEKLEEIGGEITVQTSDIDIGDGVSGVNGQDVFITGGNPIKIDWELSPIQDLMSDEEIEGKTNLESLRRLSSRLNSLFDDLVIGQNVPGKTNLSNLKSLIEQVRDDFEDEIYPVQTYFNEEDSFNFYEAIGKILGALWCGYCTDADLNLLDNSDSSLSHFFRCVSRLLYRCVNYDNSFDDWIEQVNKVEDLSNSYFFDSFRWLLKIAGDNYHAIQSYTSSPKTLGLSDLIDLVPSGTSTIFEGVIDTSNFGLTGYTHILFKGRMQVYNYGNGIYIYPLDNSKTFGYFGTSSGAKILDVLYLTFSQTSSSAKMKYFNTDRFTEVGIDFDGVNFKLKKIY